MSTTFDTTSSVSFAEHLNKLRTQYETASIRNARNAEAVIKATDYFLDTYIRSESAKKAFEENAVEAATFGKKLVQLEAWSGRGPIHANQALSDLLDTGDLCSRLQDCLNESYGEDEFRVFHYPIRSSRTTALTISWDKSGFENADNILRSNRERAQQRLNHEDESHDDRPHRRFQPREQSDEQPREQREFKPREQREFKPREQQEFKPRGTYQDRFQPRDDTRAPYQGYRPGMGGSSFATGERRQPQYERQERRAPIQVNDVQAGTPLPNSDERPRRRINPKPVQQ